MQDLYNATFSGIILSWLFALLAVGEHPNNGVSGAKRGELLFVLILTRLQKIVQICL